MAGVPIRVRVVVDAPLARVWDELADIESHVEWMTDAVSLEFADEQRRGVGTRFECATRVGPFRTRDHITVTEWRERKQLGVRHTGLVTGEGSFSLRRSARSPRERTVVTRRERLSFPWYLGGPVTGLVARPFLRRIWRADLSRLAARCAGHGGEARPASAWGRGRGARGRRCRGRR